MSAAKLPGAALDYARALWAEGVDFAWLENAEQGWSILGTGSPVSLEDWEAAMATLPAGTATTAPGLGWVGWIDYSWMLGRLGLGSVNESATRFLRLRGAMRFDAQGATWIHELPDDAELGSQRALAEARLASAIRSDGARGAESRGERGEADRAGTGARQAEASTDVGQDAGNRAVWRADRARYEGAVREALARIADGDAYVVCLTTAADVPGQWDALATYEDLRRSNPTHHLALIRIGDMSLVAASPESFLTLEGGRTASTRPIKGTRPRGANEAEDVALREELAHDPKERAENLMVVDVARNDLSRICTPGTVEVKRFREVESYPAVHQLVSEVRGTLEPGTSVATVLASLAPGTSMTGAPKRRAAQIASGLEPGGRGVYSGAFGWIGASGCADLAMSIRCAVISPDHAMVGVGGGITADSDPAAEFDETRLKAAATLACLRPAHA